MRRSVFGLVLGLIAGTAMAEAPIVDPKDDRKYMAAVDESILFLTPAQRVSTFRNIDNIWPTRKIEAGGEVLVLPENKTDLGNVPITVGETTITVNDYKKSGSVGGLLVVKDGEIVYEYYGLGNTKDTRWISFSVAKSVVAMLIGAAVQDGYIKTIDESVTDYLPRLKNSSYDQSTIKNIIQMSSGVKWDETYADPEADVNQATWQTIELYEYLRELPREHKPGDVFNYNTAETNLAGTLLRSAIGNNLATYLSDKIWKPFGMESDASWQLSEPGGGEFGGCCIQATLRDYARLGLFALSDGVLKDGTRVLPENWMKDSVTPSKGYQGYGYFWWLGPAGDYQATGIYGQGIYINPQHNIVIAIHSARDHASEDSEWAWQFTMYGAIVKSLVGGEELAAAE